MSNIPLLGNVKGNSRTFVVHSNANPYAAAAAMGAAMGRSQQIGPYFNLSQTPNSGVAARDATATKCDLTSSDLSVDLIGDWSDFLRQKGMAACGLSYDELRTLEDNTMRYLGANRRLPMIAPRTVHESRELCIPQEYRVDYVALKGLITSSGDLRPYLSRDVLKKRQPDKKDKLLNSEGIQHLHFRREGSPYILLCRITHTEVFVIQTLLHDADVWVDTSLLQILHDNWPEEIVAGKCHGLKGEDTPSSERLALRSQNANFTTTVRDGTVYLATGGGITGSGDCFDDRRDCDKIFEELMRWQRVVKNNAARFRTALNWPASKELSIRMMFDDRNCWLYEPTTGSVISLNIET